eukprot:1220801-Ditylum_brightwellii.AAC.2
MQASPEVRQRHNTSQDVKIPDTKKIQMRKKKVNLLHHHTLNNQNTSGICPRAMKTVTTKHKARNRHRRKSTKSQ